MKLLIGDKVTGIEELKFEEDKPIEFSSIKGENYIDSLKLPAFPLSVGAVANKKNAKILSAWVYEVLSMYFAFLQ